MRPRNERIYRRYVVCKWMSFLCGGCGGTLLGMTINSAQKEEWNWVVFESTVGLGNIVMSILMMRMGLNYYHRLPKGYK